MISWKKNLLNVNIVIVRFSGEVECFFVSSSNLIILGSNIRVFNVVFRNVYSYIEY